MNKTTPLLLTLAFLFVYGQIAAQCISGDCKNGIGVYLFPNKTRYTGEFKDNNISGIGGARYPDGSKYHGSWEKGLPNGYGVKLNADGTQKKGIWGDGYLLEENVNYKGQSSNCLSGDCLDGVGIFAFPSGSIYVGEFSDGRINGLGVCYYVHGNRYEGYWSNRLPDGQGILTYANGHKQAGVWKNGELKRIQNELADIEYHKPEAVPEESQAEPQTPQVVEEEPVPTYQGPQTVHQESQMTHQEFQSTISNVDIQWGCLSGDCKNGKGRFLFMDGTRYDGDFQHGELHGQGIAFLPDGTKIIAMFENGIQHGRGSVHYANGKIRRGYWKHGEYVGENPNAPLSHFQGCAIGNCQNGYGQYIFQDGTKYIGTFTNGELNGKGMVIYPNGEKYAGELTNGRYNGKGTMHLKGGRSKSGLWKNNQFLGEDPNAGIAATPATPDKIPQAPPPAQVAPSTITISQVAPPEQNTNIPTQYDAPPQATSTTLPTYKPSNNAEGQISSQAGMNTAQTSPRGVKVWAVIVGVGDYQHAPVLQYTDDDAYRFYAFLRSAEGGGLTEEQITILIDADANKNNILYTMRSVFSKADQDDLIILYFSGHGMKGAFLPSDFDGHNNLLFHREVNQILDSNPAKYKMCIADACHSGSLFTAKSATSETKLLQTYYTTLAQSKAGTALIMSSKTEESSLESSGLRQGIFTHFLIRGLKGESDVNADKIVNVTELFNYVQGNVRSYTRRQQSPMIDGDYDPKMTVSVVK